MFFTAYYPSPIVEAQSMATRSTITFTSDDTPAPPIIRQEKPPVVTAPDQPTIADQKRSLAATGAAQTTGKNLPTRSGKGSLPQTNEDRYLTAYLSILGLLILGLFLVLLIWKRTEEETSETK